MPGAAASLVASTVTAESVVAEAELLAAEQVPALPASPSVTADGASAVTLGFSDGASVALSDDDPRVRTFRAAAAALLDAPSR